MSLPVGTDNMYSGLPPRSVPNKCQTCELQLVRVITEPLLDTV